MLRSALLLGLFLAAARADDPPLPKDALPLPEAPKSDPKSEHKALQKDNSLILETKPDKTKRVLLTAEVCLREGPLELLLCKKESKEHESILRTSVDAKFIHAALEACGAKPGTPVQWVNDKGEPDYKAATGAKIEIKLHLTRDGKPVTEDARDWIHDIKTKKPMATDWVFAGSKLVKNPDRPDDPAIYLANLGEVISVSNKRESMLEVPIKSTDADADLLFMANTDKIPPLLSKVWIILEPVVEKKK